MSVRDHPHFLRSRIILFVVVLFTAGSVAAQSTDLTQGARTLDGQISIRLPQGWMSRDTGSVIFTSTLAIGDSAESLQSVVSSLAGEPGTMESARMNGYVGIVSPQFIGSLPTSLAMSTLLNAMIQDVQSISGRVDEQQSLMIGDQYPASMAVVSLPGSSARGIIGVFQAGADIAEFSIGVAPARAFDANRQTFFDIVNSIRIPAEDELPVQPTLVPVPTPVLPPTTEAVTLETFRSSDQRVSLDLPDPWTVTDQIAAQNTLAYGDSPEAAQSRLASARPDLAQAATLTGRGGLLILYPLSAFRIDPAHVDLGPLMAQALGQLKGQGYSTTEAKPLDASVGGLYASIEGAEVGYLALIPFGDQVVYVTATGVGTTAQPEDPALFAILGSVRSPAVPESASGLGGLGGLVATPEATSRVRTG